MTLCSILVENTSTIYNALTSAYLSIQISFSLFLRQNLFDLFCDYLLITKVNAKCFYHVKFLYLILLLCPKMQWLVLYGLFGKPTAVSYDSVDGNTAFQYRFAYCIQRFILLYRRDISCKCFVKLLVNLWKPTIRLKYGQHNTRRKHIFIVPRTLLKKIGGWFRCLCTRFYNKLPTRI